MSDNRCRYCHRPLGWLHGHGACLASSCPMFGFNQDECCQGGEVDAAACSS